jgi:hypothetical protein
MGGVEGVRGANMVLKVLRVVKDTMGRLLLLLVVVVKLVITR